MKVKTVGRDQSNNIVISDDYVGRRHLEIIKDDEGNFILRDLNSTNGTYVNGRRINGEIYLNKNDIIRIGNTTLPWRKYIEDEEAGTTIVNASPKQKKKRIPINWRNLFTIVTSIVSFLLMVLMLLRYLK